jgi:hypothetical protein
VTGEDLTAQHRRAADHSQQTLMGHWLVMIVITHHRLFTYLQT